MHVTNSPYLNKLEAHIPKLFSQVDRESFSRTYGCFDRTYWAWKFTDFPGSRFQEAVYALTWLYQSNVQAGKYFQSEKLLEWIVAGFQFWRSLQHQDGSFDEAYPFEHSLAATAFTGFYLGEAFERVQLALPESLRSSLVDTFTLIGDWLIRNDEYHGVLSNHLAAAAAALTVIESITGDARFGGRSQHFLERIYAKQSSEGWYEEYGGADPGYQTHGTFYLARIWQRTQDPRLLDSLRRSVTFLKYVIHPNGTLGGEYASRNTSFYFPAGFEILAKVIPEAAAIATFMRTAVLDQSASGLDAVDAYNFCPILNNYLFADDNFYTGAATPPLPHAQIGEWYFPDAGLYVKSTDFYYAIIGLSKGGVVKVYDKTTGNLALSDCGYWAELSNHLRVSSQSLCHQNRVQVHGGRIVLEVPFVKVNQTLMTPWLFVAFRGFSLTIGRLQQVAYWLKDRLVHVLVRQRKPIQLKLLRTVLLDDQEVRIEDEITSSSSIEIYKLLRGDKFSTIHMGSSRYFQPDELQALTLPDSEELKQTLSWKAS